ncbi:MAG: sensor domain-containing diguanylate cyclase [bacterium]
MFVEPKLARSLLPHPGKVYALSRLIFAGALAIWLALEGDTNFQAREIFYGLAPFTTLSAAAYLLRNTVKRSSQVFVLLSIMIDAGFVTYLIRYTGAAHSPFYLLYYPVVMFAAFYFSRRASLALAATLSGLYVFACPALLQILSPFELGMRLLTLWLLPLAVNFAASNVRGSENRLFRLLDSLNESTTELERYQRRIETIYETSHALGAILKQREISVKVLTIVEEILGYENCSIMLQIPNQGLIREIARLHMGERYFADLPEPEPPRGLIAEVVESGESRLVPDLQEQTRYTPITRGTRSVLIVPMISQGKAIGVLAAEALRPGQFAEIDQKVFSILAAEAAMAYENARLHEELEKLAVTDDLTETFNFRYFEDRLEEEKRRARRYSQPLSLLMIDIDWFKRCNDKLGHQTGNIVLKGVAEVIGTSIRDTDILCRYGGEEFVVILPQTEHPEALRVGERVRANVEATTLGGEDDYPETKVTVSVGVTTYPDNGAAPERLVQLVDQAMYRAKEMGKNRVAVL